VKLFIINCVNYLIFLLQCLCVTVKDISTRWLC